MNSHEFNSYKYNCKHQQSVPSCRLASGHQVSSVMSEFPLSPRHLTETLGSGPSPPQRFLRLLTPLDSPLTPPSPITLPRRAIPLHLLRHAPWYHHCHHHMREEPSPPTSMPPLEPSAWTTSTLNSSAPSKFYSQDRGGTMESPLIVELAEI